MNRTLPKTDVPWATHSWPILRGCSAISDGCKNCYARTWHDRFAKYMKLPPWGTAHWIPENLSMPVNTKRPSRVFVAPMSDLGHETVQPEWRCLIAEAMQKAPQHQYIVLTKRPGPWLRLVHRDCWVGVTIETQAHSIRWSQLRGWAWPGAVKFVSVEPMLSAVTFDWCGSPPDWVIAGPETGAKKRPCNPAWIDDLAAESPCFFDKREPIDGTRREWPDIKERARMPQDAPEGIQTRGRGVKGQEGGKA